MRSNNLKAKGLKDKILMEWPKELLDIFEDPLLDDVRPKAIAPTANDRLALKLVEITDWVEAHGREPQKDGDLAEKMLFASLKSMRNRPDKSALKIFDRLNLLSE